MPCLLLFVPFGYSYKSLVNIIDTRKARVICYRIAESIAMLYALDGFSIQLDGRVLFKCFIEWEGIVLYRIRFESISELFK